MAEKPFDINILSKDGRRGTLSELKADFRRRDAPIWRRAVVVLALAVFPMAYAAAMPLVSGQLSAPWFQAWVEMTDWLSQATVLLLPGLETGSRRIYGGDPAAVTAFLHFASIDLLCILGTCLALLGLTSLPSITPRDHSLHLTLLRDYAKGLRYSRFSDKRIGGAAGGVFAAMAGVALVIGALHVFYFNPMVSGEFFADAYLDCAALEPGDPCLGSTVWRLGWKSSIATAAIPVGLWFCLASALYPFWLILGRPTRA